MRRIRIWAPSRCEGARPAVGCQDFFSPDLARLLHGLDFGAHFGAVVNTYIHVWLALDNSGIILSHPATLEDRNMGTTKKANYTPEQTAELVEAYQAADSDESRAEVVSEYAEKFGKPLQSIRAKLVSESVYVAKAYKTKKGEKPESKSKIVGEIAAFLGVHQEAVESLEKANKAALSLIRGTLAALPDPDKNPEEDAS